MVASLRIGVLARPWARAELVSKSWSQWMQATNERKTEPRPAVPGPGGHALNPENMPPQARVRGFELRAI